MTAVEIWLAARLTQFAEGIDRMNDHEKFIASSAIVTDMKALVMQLIEESRA